MKTPHLRVFAVLASLIGLTVATPCLARNEAAYSSSMPHTYKKAYAIWRAHLPQRYRHIGWAARFNGYALPIREVTLLGQPMLFFESCKPCSGKDQRGKKHKRNFDSKGDRECHNSL